MSTRFFILLFNVITIVQPCELCAETRNQFDMTPIFRCLSAVAVDVDVIGDFDIESISDREYAWTLKRGISLSNFNGAFKTIEWIIIDRK